MLACWATSLTAAQGAAAHERAALSYEAPPTCPDARAFDAQVRARVTRPPAPDAPPVVVQVALERDGAAAVIRTTGPSGALDERRVVARRCSDVVAAAALVVSILLDPNADTTPPPLESPPSEPPPAPPTPLPFTAGVQGSWITGVAPSALWGPGVFAELSRRYTSGWEPSLRLSGSRALSGTTSIDGGGRAAFGWWNARLELCAARWLGPSLRIQPCLFGDAGALGAAGQELVSNRETVPTAGVGPALELGALWAGRLLVSARAAGRLSFYRYHYYFEPTPEAGHTSPRFGLELGASIGLRNP